MLELLSCPRGHFWESADRATTCPECGAPAESLPLLELVPSEPPPAPAGPAPLLSPLPLLDSEGRPVVAGYQVHEEVGRGPTGVRYYRAKQQVLNRTVLLKVVLARNDTGQQAWGSLRGEASALARLSHPNIVQIYEAGERERQVFYNAVELVGGPTLAQKVADKPLPLPQVMLLMETLARAVDHAHTQGLLHRNLKPSSVLLDPWETDKHDDVPQPAAWCQLHSKHYLPKITDWGLGRKPIEGDITDLDLFGDEGGYLAPEQAWGRARDIGPATDVYGLGGILYFLLTGRPPFKGPTTSDILDAVQSADLVAPSAIRGVPADLETICRKALAKPPRRRYPNALALALDLRRAYEGYPVKARVHSAAERFGKWVRRRPAVAALLGANLLTLVGGGIVLLAIAAEMSDLDRELAQARLEVRRQQQVTASSRRELEALRSQEQFNAYRQRLSEAAKELEAGRAGPARRVLEMCPADQRHVEWYHLLNKANGDPEVKLGTFAGPVTGVAFSPEGEQAIIWPRRPSYLAVAGEGRGKGRSTVRMWELPRKVLLHQWDDLSPVQALAFSPDGQFVAVAGGAADGGALSYKAVQDFRQGEEWQQPLPRSATDLAFSPDGQSIYVASGDGMVTKLSRGNGRPVGVPFGQRFDRPGRTMTTRLAISPDGWHVATATLGEHGVRVYDPNTGRLLFTVTTPGGALALAFAPAGRLAVGLTDNSVQLYDDRGVFQERLSGHTSDVTRVCFSPDGHRLASASEDGTIKVWAHGGASWAAVLTLDAPNTTGLAFSRSGKGLAAGVGNEVVLFGSLGD